ncbi:MAG TPA: mucoidy inhibitor MuiA family protein [Xanthobacteraceae bacterium]|nr:mucoidy inhibitor MuiA family protein [Xanthobacteraceae bacterium]
MTRPFAHLPVACVLVFAGLGPLPAAELDVRSAVDAVTVYPDGATVTRLITVDLPRGDTTLIARDFPPGLDASSLRVEGETGARVTIGAIDARAPRPERPPTAPELEQRWQALKDERAALEDQIGAEAVRKRFAERFAAQLPLGLGEKGEARPIAEWRLAFGAVAEEIRGANNAIRELKLKQRELDEEIARIDRALQANPPRKMEVRIDLAADAGARATFRVSYTVRGARWAPLYDARLDTGTRERKPALELIRRAEIVQQTGEDWSDVALSVSTVRTAKGGGGPELRPLVVRYAEPASSAAAKSPRLMQERSALRDDRSAENMAAFAPPSTPAQEQETAIETGGYQALFRVPGRVTIATNEGAKSLRISTATIAPDLLVRTAPALDETAYLEASMKHAEEAPLLAGRVALYRDGIFVGRGTLALTPKDETLRLGFGADEKVKVARVLTRKLEGTAGIISSAKTDEREFKTTVRSGHNRPMRIVVEDQIPTSEIADILVEMLPGTTPPTERDVRDRRGVLAWSFDAAPGEAKEIKLGWRLRWPGDKVVAYEPRRP